MQYEIEGGGRPGQPRRVVVHRSGGVFTVEIDGRSWTVDAQRMGAHSLSLLISDVGSGLSRTVSREVTIVTDASGQKTVTIRATPVVLSLNGRRRAGAKGDKADNSTGPQRLLAPMPGKVVRVLVKPGDEVRARQPILVIEAMKMENELRAAAEGVISELHAKEGQSVDAGSLLAVIVARDR